MPFIPKKGRKTASAVPPKFDTKSHFLP